LFVKIRPRKKSFLNGVERAAAPLPRGISLRAKREPKELNNARK
jgi:hypothetical protein